MDAQTVVSFVRFMNENPKLKHNRKAFKKLIDKIGNDSYNIRRKNLMNAIENQKQSFMECFDIYEKFVKEHGSDLFSEDINVTVDNLVKAFGIELKDAEAADKKMDEADDRN